MSVFRAELHILMKQIEKAFSEAELIAGSCGVVASAESYLRSFSKDKARRAEIVSKLEAILPGLAGLIKSFSKNKNAGAEIEAIRRRYSQELNQETDAYLRGLILECFLKHNKVLEAKELAISSSGTVSSQYGLRWSYFSAKTFLALNEPEKALIAVNQFIEEFPDAKVPFLHLRGLIHRQMGLMEKAADDLLSSVKLDPSYVAPIWALYFIVQKGIAVDDCINVVSAAMHDRPDEPLYPRMLADAYTAKGDIPSAIPLYVESSKMMTIADRPNLAKLKWPEQAASKPDFIIIGAPKGGTTSAYGYMQRHPKILGATVKEISFFGSDNKYVHGIEWYMSHFPSLAGHDGYITGEASPGYFYSDAAREQIAKHFPDVRLILFLRNPTARAISGYYQHKKMHGSIDEIKAYFDKHLKQAEGKTAKQITARNSVFAAGVYHPTVRKWYRSFGRKSLLIVKAEDLFTSPTKVMKSIYTHLGLEDIDRKNFHVANKGLYPPAPDALIKRLEDFYRPFNGALYDLIDRDMEW